ncbi:MAG: hypothetical protein K9J50_02720 [Sulfuritalea sp.]|nr:hypothetical protein [Sulfuritalea sp.]
MESLKDEISAVAARMVVEEGLDFGAAKRRAVKQMGLTARSALPSNEEIERAVEDYIAVFCAESQATELHALRVLALEWMDRLAPFRPHVAGAVWHGSATRNSDIYLQLFCADAKEAELGLIDRGVRFEVRSVPGFQGERVDALSVHVWSPVLEEHIGLHLLIYDLDDIRGALHPDARGRRPRGDATALRAVIGNSL